MVKKILISYQDSFSGLSKEVWWLALITFINRAGTMVLPFLSLYLTEDLNLEFGQVGWIMTSFGLGSLLGSYLGGKLTDQFGFYRVMIWSLLLTGFLFIGLQYINSFEGFAIGIFMTMTVADTFRPAMFVSLKAYSKPKNQTRSLTLIRLAINLGFSFGPFLGGLIIASLNYLGLFWVDGITCVSAVVLMLFVLKQKEFHAKTVEEVEVKSGSFTSVYQDKPYWIFLAVVFLMGFIFLQLFTTMPLYYKEIHSLTEVQIGLIMSLNGFLIFLLEMPLIHYIEQKLLNKMKIITWSLMLFSFSFLILNISLWTGVLIIGMLFITVGEMLAFPFTNNFAMNRAPSGKEGRYLALYSMAFSFAHIFSAKIGMEIIDRFGYAANWYLMGGLGLVAVLLMILLRKSLRIT
ncbi:Predicted arabinose efflux permease, MFS family [Lutibacter agarilyticus]|uniref:Predicted arabinose efflux permease, MFS family n=1 Tax=Lutibacter agarilyticus TaxID=1109740 RepID=A0A238WJ38_9FLAO|nr:MFS transporter [Lutibacter agarilyticus]SNR46582.1 Predicted arabinose efflux permease, MFS family [Lutibacter agarilyticus]